MHYSKKVIIGFVVAAVVIVTIILSYINFHKRDMYFDMDGEYAKTMNELLDTIKKNMEDEDLPYDVEKAKNKDVYSMLITVYDENPVFISYNIDLDTKEAIGNDELAQRYGTTIDEIENLIKERLKQYYYEEKDEGYIDPNECDFECYKVTYRNISNIEDSYVLYVKHNKLYIYITFDPDSVIEDKEYFDKLNYNPHVIEI